MIQMLTPAPLHRYWWRGSISAMGEIFDDHWRYDQPKPTEEEPTWGVSRLDVWASPYMYIYTRRLYVHVQSTNWLDKDRILKRVQVGGALYFSQTAEVLFRQRIYRNNLAVKQQCSNSSILNQIKMESWYNNNPETFQFQNKRLKR